MRLPEASSVRVLLLDAGGVLVKPSFTRVAEALALGQLFQDLPPCLIIYGIEGHNFGPGQEVSEEVEAAIPEAVRRIRREIAAWLERDPPEGHPSGTGEQS